MNLPKDDSKLRLAALIALSTALPLCASAQDDSEQDQQARQQSPNQSQAASGQQSAGSHQSQGRQSAGEDRTEIARADDRNPSRAEQQPNPFAQADDSWISISGVVDDVRPQEFTLDYGDGLVTVEMDDKDRDADAYQLETGDSVTAYGLIDDDLFEIATIEASSIYVDKIDTYFYSSAVDEEDLYVVALSAPIDLSAVALHGVVIGVDGDEFEVDAGSRTVRVDVDEMSYDPLDDEGYQKIEVGDMVSVRGEVDRSFFEGRELKAQSVTTLVEELG